MNNKKEKMGGSVKRGISPALLVMIIMIFLLKTSSSTAATAVLYNNTTRLIADDLHSDFFMDTEIRRMLGGSVTQGTGTRAQAIRCGRDKLYGSCLPRGGGPPPENCNPYEMNRGCSPKGH